jgi:hypothetical protein
MASRAHRHHFRPSTNCYKLSGGLLRGCPQPQPCEVGRPNNIVAMLTNIHITMAYTAKKTAHTGVKHGRGASWGRQQDAKLASNTLRRRQEKRIVRYEERLPEQTQKDTSTTISAADATPTRRDIVAQRPQRHAHRTCPAQVSVAPLNAPVVTARQSTKSRCERSRMHGATQILHRCRPSATDSLTRSHLPSRGSLGLMTGLPCLSQSTCVVTNRRCPHALDGGSSIAVRGHDSMSSPPSTPPSPTPPRVPT